MTPRQAADLADKIIKDSGIPIKDFPRHDSFIDARTKLWERGKAMPMSVHHAVFAIFDWNGGDDVVIYGVPIPDRYPEDGFKRVVIPRKAIQGPEGPVISALVSSMTIETFESAIADELWDAWEAATAAADLRVRLEEARAALKLIAGGAVRVGSDDVLVADGDEGLAQLRDYAATILRDTAPLDLDAAAGGGGGPDPAGDPPDPPPQE